MSRILAAILALGAILGLYALLRVVQRWDPARLATPLTPDQMTMQAENAVMVAREHGQTLWKLRVNSIVLRRPRDSDLTDFHAVDFAGVHEGTVFDEGRKVASFSAGSATYERPLKRLDVQRGIRVRTTEGEEFASDRCIWTETDEFARFPDGAKAAIKGDSVRAPNMLYSTRTRLVQCPDGAEAVFRGQPVAARSLEWDMATQRVRCTGPVTGERASVRFMAQYAELDLKNRTIRVNNGAVDLRIDGGEDAP